MEKGNASLLRSSSHYACKHLVVAQSFPTNGTPFATRFARRSPHAKNNYGKNAYDLAYDSGHKEVMNVLHSNGIGPSEDAVAAGDARKLLPSLAGSEGGGMKGPRRSRRVGRRRR
jgi:hypothetical protein